MSDLRTRAGELIERDIAGQHSVCNRPVIAEWRDMVLDLCAEIGRLRAEVAKSQKETRAYHSMGFRMMEVSEVDDVSYGENLEHIIGRMEKAEAELAQARAADAALRQGG